ncbi:hypothetical protein [Dermabacter sp. HMSC08H10]
MALVACWREALLAQRCSRASLRGTRSIPNSNVFERAPIPKGASGHSF